jgi:hypothetical protein
MDAEVILKRFNNTPTLPTIQQKLPSRLSPTDWIHMERLLRSVVEDRSSDQSNQLSASLHHLQIQNEVLHHEHKGLKASLNTKRKRKKHSKALPFEQSGEYHGGAVLYSPRAVQRARDIDATRQQEEEEEHLQKLQHRKQREEAKLLKQLQVKEEREERERAKVVKEKERAEKEAQKQRQKQERDHQKATQTSQKGKRKASRAPVSKNKRQKRSVGGAAAAAPVTQQSPEIVPLSKSSNGTNANDAKAPRTDVLCYRDIKLHRAMSE